MCYCKCIYENAYGDCIKPKGAECPVELEEDEIDKELFG